LSDFCIPEVQTVGLHSSMNCFICPLL
jgi:hypothetical protein